MSLYGLDVLVERETDRYYLGEIGGVRSGTKGFKEIYGDSRIERTVCDMLLDRYGKVTVNDGTYSRERFRKTHPVINFIWEYWNGESRNELYPFPSLDFDRADYFKVYRGQESTVLNYVNEVLPHPLVNPFTAEEIAGNKFLQYLLLRETKLARFLPQSALVGLGVIDNKELDEMLERYSMFMLKPLLDCCGEGIRIVRKDQIKDYMKSSIPQLPDDPMNEKTTLSELSAEILWHLRTFICPWVIDNRIRLGDFSFEKRIWVAQPFIDTRQTIDGKKEQYTSVRAIVCNGEFVDAYVRASTNPVVNFSKGASAHPFERDGFGDFCEKVVDVFERECTRYSPDDFRWEIYTQHFAA